MLILTWLIIRYYLIDGLTLKCIDKIKSCAMI